MKRVSNGNKTETLYFESLKSKVTAPNSKSNAQFTYGFDENDASFKASRANSILQGVIGKMQKVDDETRKVMNDASLTPAQRAEKVRPVRQEAFDNINRVLDLNLNLERQHIAAEKKKLFAIPLPTDAGTEVRYNDARSRVNAMDPQSAQYKTLMEGIRTSAPEYAELGHALATDPIPNANSEYAKAVWKARVEKENAAAARALQAEEDRNDAVAIAVAGLGQVLQGSNRAEIEVAEQKS
jgi:hypothetical protein